MPFRDDLFAGSLADAAQKYLGHNTLEPAPPPQPADDGRPHLYGTGPVEFSTSTVLAVVPEVCWDVNGYYRTMAVHWRATKRELMQAYHCFGPNPTAYQTYVFKQLLDPAVRRLYDMAPLGAMFIDAYVADDLKRKAYKRAQEMRMQGMAMTAEQVLNDMGFASFDDIDGEPPEVVDDKPVEDEDVDVPPDRKTTRFPWAFYLWKTRKIDVGRLAQWQELLVSAFSERGERVRLAVGLHGAGPHPWLVGEVGYRTVVFLNHREQPDAAMATAVVDRITQDKDPAGSRKALSS